MPTIKSEKSSPEELRKRRRSEWRRGSEETVRAQRSSRIGALDRDRERIRLALDQYALLGEARPVTLRSSALYIEEARRLPPSLGGPPWEPGMTTARARAWDLATRRPVAKLAGHRGPALNTYLSMLFVISTERRTGALNRHPTAAVVYTQDVPWAWLCGRGDENPRSRRERMGRDLRALAAARVVKMSKSGNRSSIEGFEFLNETGGPDPVPYSFPVVGALPTIGENVLMLPAAFFTNGWHLVLKAPEIAMLLTVMDAYKRLRFDRLGWDELGVPLTQHHRFAHYGISGETYHCLHTLEELGLISVHDPMPTRERGKFTAPSEGERDAYVELGLAVSPIPYQLKPRLDGMNEPAFEHAKARFDEPLPPRMREGLIAFTP